LVLVRTDNGRLAGVVPIAKLLSLHGEALIGHALK
jgi:hypothetical protein